MKARITYAFILLIGLYQKMYALEENFQAVCPGLAQVKEQAHHQLYLSLLSREPSDTVGTSPGGTGYQPKLKRSTANQTNQSVTDRWYLGVLFKTTYSFPVQLQLNPMLGFKPLPYLMVGVSGGMQITVDNHPKFRITHQWQPDYSLFTELYHGAWFLHLRYDDQWNVKSLENTATPAQLSAGIGRTYRLHKLLQGRIMMMYNTHTAQVTGAIDFRVRRGHIIVMFNPQADAYKQQKTWSLKWGIDLW